MKIPEYDLRTTIVGTGPEPTVSPSAAAAPWLALEKVGEQTMKLGAVIQDRQDEILRTKELTERSLQAESDITDLKLAIEQERDPATAADRFAEGISDIKSRVMDGVNDYKVANQLTTHLASREAEGMTSVKHEAWKWTLQDDQVDMMSQNDRWKKAAVTNPDQVDFAASMIRNRVAASVATGSILPETGRALADKETKDLYAQVMSQMILDNPRSAPDLIKPLLAKSGLDPTDMWALEQRAEHARTSYESRAARGDKAVWDSNAAKASIEIRAGRLNEAGITNLFNTSQIGPDQLNHLHNVLDSTKTRVDTDSRKVSQRAMDGILNSVFFGRVSPEVAAHQLDANSSVLPEHKTQGMQTLLSMAKSGDKIPSQMEKAMQLYRTKVAPSSFSLNPRQEEMDALGEVMREVWTDYFANEKKYQTDPDLLIKRAVEKTSPGKGPATAPPSPYADGTTLLKAYNYYVVGKHPSPNGATPKWVWQQWFNQAGVPMPEWPR